MVQPIPVVCIKYVCEPIPLHARSITYVRAPCWFPDIYFVDIGVAAVLASRHVSNNVLNLPQASPGHCQYHLLQGLACSSSEILAFLELVDAQHGMLRPSHLNTVSMPGILLCPVFSFCYLR